MSFLGHLEELRWHIIRSLLFILLAAIAAFFMKGLLFDTLLFGPKHPDFITYRVLCKISKWLGLGADTCIDQLPFSIQSRTLAGQFSSHIWASIIAGIIVGFPYLVWELWRFVKPGLTQKETRYSVWGMRASAFLFLSGVLFGYFLIAPLSINFLANYRVSREITNKIDLSSYVSTVSTAVLASGLVFQLPTIVLILTKIGLITPAFLKKYRRHALVVIMIIAAIITPPDISSLVLVTLPVLLLYELSIFISAIVSKKMPQLRMQTEQR
ncbi:MAG: twin-arginine translocase subunit TatC [Flavobacteriales bacterium]